LLSPTGTDRLLKGRERYAFPYTGKKGKRKASPEKKRHLFRARQETERGKDSDHGHALSWGKETSEEGEKTSCTLTVNSLSRAGELKR